MLDPKSLLLGAGLMWYWNFTTKPRPEPTYERVQVAQCIVESILIVYLRLPRRIARWIALQVPYSLLPL